MRLEIWHCIQRSAQALHCSVACVRVPSRKVIATFPNDCKKLHVEGLRRVNLIVGRNNSGKTSLLKAAYILLSGGDLSSLLGTALRRGETMFIREQNQLRPDLSHCFHGHLFNGSRGFRLEGNTTGTITVSFGSEAAKVLIDANPNLGIGVRSRRVCEGRC